MIAAFLLAAAFPSCGAAIPQEPAVAILDGKGAELQQAWLETRVREYASRPPPKPLELSGRKDLNRMNLMRGLGLEPAPPRGPLNARVTGVLQREGYRIEKIAFESRPNFWATAHLYVPAGDGPFPVILNPHGHWAWKKTEPVVQARLISQARHGYVAMIVDSPGGSFEGSRPVERRQQGSHDEWRLAMSVGTTTGLYVWDLMRALDYLETRPEADMTRVGITGASGGGTATVYTFAVDPRIDCAVPVVYATSLAVNPHNGCLCNHVPGTLRIGDRADVLSIRAPAPVLVIGATDDEEFPPAGTMLTGEKLKKLWSLEEAPNAADAVNAVVFPGPHDYGKAMRETAMGFFDLHLKGIGDGSPVPEPEIKTEPPDAAELVVLPEWPADSLTMLQVAREALKSSRIGRSGPFWKGAEIEATEPMLKVVLDDTEREWLRCSATGMIDLPAVAWKAHGTPRGLLYLLDDGGKDAAAARFDARALAEAGYLCIAADLPGVGELTGIDQRLANYLGCGPMPIAATHLTYLHALLIQARPAWKDLPVGILAAGPYLTTALTLKPAWDDMGVKAAVCLDAIASWEEVFDRQTTALAAQPFAAQGRALAGLRRNSRTPLITVFRDQPAPDWQAALAAAMPER